MTIDSGLRPAGFVAFFLTAVALAACAPSVDPAAKADIDRRAAALAPGGTSYPAPGGFEPMPLAVGQWSQYKIVDDKQQPSFLTYKIVGEDAGAFWLETVHETYSGRMVQKLLVAFGNRMDVNQIEIRAVKTKDTKGHVTEMPPSLMPMLQSSYKNIVSSLVMHWQGLPQEQAVVPAGRFDGCFHIRSDAQWGPWKSTADAWAHPSVPLSGAVRTQGVDRPFTMELVAFGTTGATDEF